jgi:thioredoxin 1
VTEHVAHVPPAGPAEPVIQVSEATWPVVVLDSPLPVLADFTADWCPPCQALAPRISGLATANRKLLRVVCVEVDSNPQLASTYKVDVLPTTLLLIAGEVVDSFEGAPPASVLYDELRTHVPGLRRPAEAASAT